VAADSVDIPLPRSGDSRGMLAWALTLVNYLRRADTRVAETVTEVIEPIVADQEATLAAAEDYATDVQAAITAAGGFAQATYDQYAAAAAANQAQLAQFYLTEAANRVEAQVRVTEDGVSSTKIDTVAAYLAGSMATIETIEDAVANGDTAIATRIDNVQTQANGNSASVSTLTTSVNGLNAQWGVAIDVNGHVVGLVQLDGSASGSTFLVVADKFIISHPSSSGTLITPFVVGLVDGVSTVGINGNLVIDGNILARHLAVGSVTAAKIDVADLSAIAADIGTVTAGRIESANGNSFWDLDSGEFQIAVEI